MDLPRAKSKEGRVFKGDSSSESSSSESDPADQGTSSRSVSSGNDRTQDPGPQKDLRVQQVLARGLKATEKRFGGGASAG